MKFRVEKVIASKRKREIKDIYTSAFLKEDRMPFWMMQAMSCLWNTEFLAYYDGDALCGFIYAATLGKQTFVMFFAVASNLRSKGYGSRILDMMQSRHPANRIIVSIEPCDDGAADLDQRLKRRSFYEKNGYERTGYYIRLGGKEQELLIRNGVFSKPKFLLFFMLYSNFTVIPKIHKVTT